MTKADLVICISDLHLTAERPDLFQAFTDFLNKTAVSAKALYILGDFFNVWIGDDDPDPFAAGVRDSLKELTDSGTAVYLMHGNRDFLLGKTFTDACNAILIPEPYVLTCFGREYLLMHGDSLCTRDEEYMEFRRMVRSTDWQQGILARSIEERRAFAAEARAKSKSMSSNKPDDIMDVTPEEVTSLLQEYEQNILIHGHTHRPAVHELSLPSGPGVRIVLGDWDELGWYLSITPDNYRLENFPIQA